MRVLPKFRASVCTLRTRTRRLARDNNFAACAVPRWNPVSPPQLPRDAPVIDVAHPVEINLLVIRGREPDVIFLHNRDRALCQRLDLDEPLCREPCLNHSTATCTLSDRDRVILLAN